MAHSDRMLVHMVGLCVCVCVQVIGRIGRITLLNGAAVSVRERTDSEVRYLQVRYAINTLQTHYKHTTNTLQTPLPLLHILRGDIAGWKLSTDCAQCTVCASEYTTRETCMYPATHDVYTAVLRVCRRPFRHAVAVTHPRPCPPSTLATQSCSQNTDK